MDVKKQTFDETACEIVVYGGAYARFFVEGDSCEVPKTQRTPREKTDCVSRRNAFRTGPRRCTRKG